MNCHAEEHYNNVRNKGIEPLTPPLSRERSTTELNTHEK